MKWALAIMYVAAGVTVSSVALEMDRHRCDIKAPAVYVLTTVAWPVFGSVVTLMQLGGAHTYNACAGAN